MSEYIEREALYKILENWRDAHADVDDADGCGLLEDVMWEVRAQTAADVVAVVRCRDCENYKPGKHFTDINFCQRLPYYAEKGGLNTADDDFCSYGERRSDND